MRNKIILKLKHYIKRFYRLTLNSKKQEEIVWSDLKKYHNREDWKSGVYEKERYVETLFDISNGKSESFFYMIYDGYFHCKVKILEDFDPDLTTDLFILAAHLNNHLIDGIVRINVNREFVEYHVKCDILLPLLYPGEIHGQSYRHFNSSKDIYSAFQRLVVEGEIPAIIIGDLKNEDERRDNDKE